MEKCVILCRLKVESKVGNMYDQTKTIAIGPFDDHETAGEFMREFMDSEDKVRECLGVFYNEEMGQFHGWEVVDMVMKDYIAVDWEDHDKAMRSHQERGANDY
ncbi:MAG: hypothetical protein JXA22_00210 [Candidatus Thermoplasmatota archaeon]|nr:hypothetical protein [Candidatus Thermoplasmatota archaeon]